MVISKTMEDAVREKDLGKIHSAFYTIMLSDPGFTSNKFDEAFSYVMGRGIEGVIQPHNGTVFEDESKWDQAYWDRLASELMDNFSLERIEHLKAVSRYVYPRIEKDHEQTVQKKTEPIQTSVYQKKTNTGMLIALAAGILIVLIIILVLFR